MTSSSANSPPTIPTASCAASTWLTAYARTLTTRDVAEIADVSKTTELSRLIDHAAVASGQTVNLSALGSPLGVEVKAASSVKPENFHGLRRLQDATGRAFACGIILHDGDRLQRTGDRLFAMPVRPLWA